MFTFRFLFSLLLIERVFNYNILLLAPFCTRSHKMSIDPAINELVSRGHQVTEVAMEVNQNSTGIIQYHLHSLKFLLMDAVKDEYNPFTPVARQENLNQMLYRAASGIGRAIMEDGTFQRFRNESKHLQFDVVIVGKMLNDIILPIAHQFNAPIVSWSTSGLTPYEAWLQNVPFLTSYVTSAYSFITTPLNFADRVSNTVEYLREIFWHQTMIMPTVQSIYEEYSKEPFPQIVDIKRNISLVLVNSHSSMEDARPLMPNIITVGAMHCRPAQPLPKSFSEIASASNTSGFIIFSLGSIVHGKSMPKHLVAMFLRVFGDLKPNVIWKFEGEVENVPPNVIIKNKWIPQQDLLGHPHCRLAILHGGLNSLQEAVYHGIPVLGIPLGSDRDSNLARAVNEGMAEVFDWRAADEQILYAKLISLLENKKYRKNAERLSAILKDRPDSPAKTAAYWIEYVIRHKGAHHLKSKVAHLNLVQYFLLDVYIYLAAHIIILLAAMWYGAKLLYSFTRSVSMPHRRLK